MHTMKNLIHRLLPLLLLSLLQSSPAGGAGTVAPSPTATDKCPVCGMFVSKYPEWVEVITFRDSTSVFFDGAKDLLIYYLNMKKYNPEKTADSIASVRVKDYYSLNYIDARKAFYVIGSNVYGPMGKELIPFAKDADAREFLKDHKGKQILRFSEITPQVMKSLE
jgi:nitrous oxide reductase accessory protein NosL